MEKDLMINKLYSIEEIRNRLEQFNNSLIENSFRDISIDVDYVMEEYFNGEDVGEQ